MTLRLTFALIFSLLQGGCASSYVDGRFSITGGYYQSTIADNLEKISYSGNGFTTVDMAEKYTLLRCAEYAKEHNSEYFMLFGSLTHAAHAMPSEPGVWTIGTAPSAYAFVVLLPTPANGSRKTDDVLHELEYLKYQ